MNGKIYYTDEEVDRDHKRFRICKNRGNDCNKVEFMATHGASKFCSEDSDFKKLIAHAFSEHFPKREKEKSLPKLLTMSEVMIHFSITNPTIYKWVKFNILPEPLKIGGLVYFRKEDVELMIANNK